MMRPLLLSLILFIALPIKAAYIDEVANNFEIYMEKTLNQWGVPGAAVVIVQGDQTILMRGFGVRQVGRPERVNSQTVFRLASLSKGLSAGLAATYVADGNLDWNDRVTEYLPDFKLKDPYQTQQLSVKHILSHSTGLPQHTYTHLIENNTPYQTAVDRLSQVPLKCNVGTCHAYQNVSYSLISDILTTQSGQSFSRMMDERIFTPLNMNYASTTYEEFMASHNRASCHVKGKNGFVACTVTPNYYRVAPAGGINASASDMAQWLRAQMGMYPEVLPPKLLKEMHTPVVKTNEVSYNPNATNWRQQRIRSSYYGLGWRIYDYAGTKIVFHGGMLKGFQNVIAFAPDRKVGIAILTNSSSPVAGLLCARFFDTYLKLPEKDWSSMALGR